MLDINFIKENAEYMKDVVAKKNVKCDIDELLTTYAEYKKVNAQIEEVNFQINQNAKKIKDCKDVSVRQQFIDNGGTLKKSQKISTQFDELKTKYASLMSSVPKWS